MESMFNCKACNLSATRDDNYVTANIYDGSGNRAWKLSGELQLMWQNGLGWVGSGDLNLRSWYQSEHMTLTDQGYTKHYFIEGQRIASKLGTGFAALEEGSIQQPVEPIHSELSELPKNIATHWKRQASLKDCVNGLQHSRISRLQPPNYKFQISNFQWPDQGQMGSSSFITDGSAFLTQHLQYLPFGADFIQQQNTAAYYSPFTFSGKERDFETSLSYFGARYYDAGLSIWLSVDPMSDKQASLSPYHYCAWNPIILKDPDGKLPWLVGAIVGAASEVAAQIAVNKLTGQKWNKFDYADIFASTVAGAVSSGLSVISKVNKVRKVKAAIASAHIAATSAIDLELNEGNDGVTLSLPGVGDESLDASGFIIDIKGKGYDEVGVEAAMGGLGAGAKKFISGAFNDDIAKKADDLAGKIKAGRGTKSDLSTIGQLEKTAEQHDMAAEALTNWSGQYTLEEVKGLMNVD